MITLKKLLFCILFILALALIVGVLFYKKIPSKVSLCPVVKPQIVTVTVIVTPVPTLTAKEKKALLLTPTQKVSTPSAK